MRSHPATRDPNPIFHVNVQIMSSDSSWFSDLWVNKVSHILPLIGETKQELQKEFQIVKGRK